VAQAERLATERERAKRTSISAGMSNFGAWFSTSFFKFFFV